MDKIIPSFRDSLFKDSKDTFLELAELGIDSILSEGLIERLPIVNLLIGVKNTVQNLYDRNLLVQSLHFLKEFNSGMIKKEKLEKYKKRISDEKKAEKELGRVLILLNRFIDIEKSKMLANLFRNYINEKINWKEFCDFSGIIESLFLSDLEFLRKVYSGKIRETKGQPVYSINRLKSLGLLDTSRKGGVSFEIERGYSPENNNVGFTKIGGKFYESIKSF